MPLGIGILVFIIDQLVKHLVVSTMHLGQSLPVIKGIFHITYVLNPGAAFGMLEHQLVFHSGSPCSCPFGGGFLQKAAAGVIPDAQRGRAAAGRCCWQPG